MILLSQEGASYARITPKGYLGAERFAVFRAAIEGARYDFERRVNLAPLDKVPGILIRLREADLEVEIDKTLHTTLQLRTAQQWLELKSVQERIDSIDKDIREKNPGKSLFSYQKVGSQWLTMKRGALLADDPGTGKTLTNIVALPANAPVLVVCPMVAKGVWVGEVEKWRPQIAARMLSGRSSFRWPNPGEMLVINYDILPEIHDTKGEHGRKCDGKLAPKPRLPCTGCKEDLSFEGGRVVTKKIGHEPGCDGRLPEEPREKCMGCHPMLEGSHRGTVLLADEAQALKDGKSLRATRFRALSSRVLANAGYAWLSTGTPMENQPLELWYVLEAAGLAHEAFGSFKNFVALFKGKQKTYGRGMHAGYEWGDPDDEVTERLQRVMLRRRKEDVLPELPDMMWTETVVEIDNKSLLRCDDLVDRYGGMDKVIEMIESPKANFETISKVLTLLAVAKTEAALDIVKDHESRKEPLLVFSMHREPIDVLGKRKGWLTITGDTKDRKAVERAFQDEKGGVKGVACTIQAAGVALTLTRAAHVLFIDRSWNPKQNEQAVARAHRIGQLRGVVATLLRADHILDKRLQESITRKERLFSQTINAASVSDDAPPCTDADFEGQIRQVQEEISNGRAVRRMAESDSDKDAVEKLHTLVFPKPSDVRLARQLGEEALMIGLSELQWKLAASVASRGLVPTKNEENGTGRGATSGATKLPAVGVGKDDMATGGDQRTGTKTERSSGLRLLRGDGGEIDMKKVEALMDRIDACSPPERSMLFAMLTEDLTVDLKKVSGLFELIRTRCSDAELEALRGMVDDNFCTSCGDTLPEEGEPAHECPDEEDEDEDDAGDSDDGDAAGDDAPSSGGDSE